MAFTLHPYDLLCKIFGSKDVVRLRRNMYLFCEAFADIKLGQYIPSGSRGEGLELEGSDFDMMIKVNVVRVYESMLGLDRLENKVKLIMDTDEVKLGFTRLKIPMDDNINNFFYRLLVMLGCVLECGGSRYLSSSSVRDNQIYTTLYPAKLRTRGPCKMWNGEQYEEEHLLCCRCKEWISLAHPWLFRPRGGWPSNEVIQTIKQSGVLFVPIGCKTSKYEHLEWRISFSSAEKTTGSFVYTRTVLMLCNVVKTIVSDVVKKLHGELLCSYFVKTIMFWISDETEPSFWRKENIVKCYLVCLKRLIYCVEYRICLHYFIPEINFFEDRFTDNEQKLLSRTLHDLYSRGWDVLVHTDTFQKFLTKLSSDILITSSPVTPIKLVFHVLNFLKNFDDPVFLRVLSYSWHYKNTVFVQYLTTLSLAMFNNFPNSYNKAFYRQYKSVLPGILIGTNSDCVSGWCQIASMFYKLKQYSRCQFIVDYCLHKCTPDKILINGSPYISLSNNVQRLLTKDKLYLRMIRNFFVQNVIIFGCLHISTSEKYFLIEMTKINPPFGLEDMTEIPPVVYLQFLDFLCNHQLKQDQAKKRSFRNLQRTVRDKFFIEEIRQTLAENFLTLAAEIMNKL